MTGNHELRSISDDELLRRLAKLLKNSRRIEADLVAHIAEVDERRLYAREAAPSMFAYCTETLHLSEAEAYLRIAAARASRKYPTLLTMLSDGRLHLSGLGKLAPHLTQANSKSLLARAEHRTKRQIEELVAELAPRPDVPPSIRKLPDRATKLPQPRTPPPQLRPDAVASVSPPVSAATRSPAAPLPPPRPAVVEPLAPARYKIQFTASAELRDKISRLQALMRASVPDGDLASVIEGAVTDKLEKLEAKRLAATRRPRNHRQTADMNTNTGTDSTVTPSPSSRHIPAPVKRAVRKRDRDRCTFVDKRGKRCTERHRLEFHHHHPYARGGDHSPDNISLMCRTHNIYRAEQDYGKEVMAAYRRPGGRGGDRDRIRERGPVYLNGRAAQPMFFNLRATSDQENRGLARSPESSRTVSHLQRKIDRARAAY